MFIFFKISCFINKHIISIPASQKNKKQQLHTTAELISLSLQVKLEFQKLGDRQGKLEISEEVILQFSYHCQMSFTLKIETECL